MTNSCLVCGKPTRSSRAKYCPGKCYVSMEREYGRRHRAEFSPERRRASNLVWTAIFNGSLKQLPCETCGTEAWIVAHHDDYAQPLAVRWLCRSCHKKHHSKFGPGKNAYRTEGAA